MLLGLMGLLDINAAILLCAIALGADIPLFIAVIIVVGLLIKAGFFIKDIGSLEDIAAAILIILGLLIAVPAPVLFVMAGLIGFKGLCSFAP